MSSLVPGFAQRYPKIDDDEAFWRDFERQAGLDHDRHAGLDPASLFIESCCTSLEEAVAAEGRGANRIELCVDLSVGGITPPCDLIRKVVNRLSIPVNVLIRPVLSPTRGRTFSVQGKPGPERTMPLHQALPLEDFVYNEEALRQMEEDIDYCRKVGAAGVVVGALTPEGAVDLPAMRRLLAAAGALPVTFHRAFDVCREDPFQTVDQLISLSCTRLLTSGRADNAWEGRELIARLVRHAGDKLIIMPGRGVRPDNLAALAAATHASEFHGTALP